MFGINVRKTDAAKVNYLKRVLQRTFLSKHNVVEWFYGCDMLHEIVCICCTKLGK